MATEVPLRAPGQMGFHPSSYPMQPLTILRGAMGLAIPAFLDFCSIAIGCIAGILLYELHRPLAAHDQWLLWAELSLR